MKYLVQSRHFEELRQWQSPRGPVSKLHYSRWETIAAVNTEQAADDVLAKQNQTGLTQWRVKYGGKVIRSLG